jgi:hypothetical protein
VSIYHQNQKLREEMSAHLGQFLIKLRIRQREILIQIAIKHERKHRRHSVYRGIANHEPTLVQRDGRKIENRGEDGLHDGNNESAVDDELRQFGRASVRVAPVPEKQLGQVAELHHGKVGREGRLLALFADDADTCSGEREYCFAHGVSMKMGHVPTSAAWIMLTSFPPSPIQQTRFLVKSLIRRATSAFCVGEHRHATTAESLVEISTNSFLNKVRQSCGAGT